MPVPVTTNSPGALRAGNTGHPERNQCEVVSTPSPGCSPRPGRCVPHIGGGTPNASTFDAPVWAAGPQDQCPDVCVAKPSHAATTDGVAAAAISREAAVPPCGRPSA